MVQTFSIIHAKSEKLWIGYCSSQAILTAITEHSWCLKWFHRLVNSFAFYFPCKRAKAILFSMTKSDDVSFIKLYRHIVVSRLLSVSKEFFVCFWQTSWPWTLSKGKYRYILGKWSYIVLVEHSLTNLYLHFFSITLISLTSSRDSSSLSIVERICNYFLPPQISA